MNTNLAADIVAEAVINGFGAWPVLGLWWVVALFSIALLAGFFCSIAYRWEPAGIVLLIIGAFALHLGGTIDIVTPFNAANRWFTIGIIAAVLVANFCYVGIKLRVKTWRKKREAEDTHVQWLKKHGVTNSTKVPTHLLTEYREYKEGTGRKLLNPNYDWRPELPRMVWWFLYAPIDALYWIWDEALRELVLKVLRLRIITASFDRITRAQYQDVLGEYWEYKAAQEAAANAA